MGADDLQVGNRHAERSRQRSSGAARLRRGQDIRGWGDRIAEQVNMGEGSDSQVEQSSEARHQGYARTRTACSSNKAAKGAT